MQGWANKMGVMVLACLAGAVASGQDEQEGPQTPEVRCTKCKHQGRLVCKQHDSDEAQLEDQVLYCSLVASCADCQGAGFVDCPRCQNEPVQEALRLRREASARSAKHIGWVDEIWNKGRSSPDVLRKVETEHFILVWEMEGIKIGRKRKNEHETMHIYAERLEQLFGDFVETFGARAGEWRKKSLVLVWYLPSDQMDGSLRFCSNASRTGVKLLGATPRFSVCASKQNFRGDEDLHRSLMHNVTHLLLSHQTPSLWIGDKKYGWADEGLAHWFEYRYFEKCTNYCYTEQNSRVDFRGGRYRVAVRKMVARGKQPGVGEVFSRTTDELTLAEHAVSFSYVDYLLHLDGKKFNALMKRLRSKEVTRDALKRIYGTSPLKFEEDWKAWVLETYPTR
ncbi:MAG TPA: hypothetical protein EYG30_11135 [Planctomycetes bacterium]|nr:hypothetical protein [Planctomycetota bacterium]